MLGVNERTLQLQQLKMKTRMPVAALGPTSWCAHSYCINLYEHSVLHTGYGTCSVLSSLLPKGTEYTNAHTSSPPSSLLSSGWGQQPLQSQSRIF